MRHLYDTPDAGPIVLRGRSFSASDLVIISRCVDEHFERGRTYISQVVCEELGWRQPNGWLKDRACRDVLRRLEEMGLITLPPALPPKRAPRTQTGYPNRFEVYDLTSSVTELPHDITLVFAKGNSAERTWNKIIDKYHYLGHQTTVGRCIKYLVKAEDRLLGALAFSSPAWKIVARDRILAQLGIGEGRVHDLVINNNRFLILPNIQVSNLASKILALATTQVVKDWAEYYCLTPQIAETFVHPSLFDGTCYKAANWVGVGLTRGYTKKGSVHHNSQEPKRVFLYGLNRSMRRNLMRAVRHL